MTICISAICDDGHGVIACADHMITGGDVQFEQAGSKITTLTPQCVALTAGPALTHKDVFGRAQLAISQQAAPSVQQVVFEVKTAYAQVRNERVEENYLRPLGLTLQSYGMASQDLVFQLVQQVRDFKLGLQIIIAGVDHSGGHLYVATDPGTAECFDALGFVAIGSGARHAEATFIAHAYAPTFAAVEAAFVAFEGRRRAESAPGVGRRLTDLVHISSEIKQFDSKARDQFDAMYRELRDNEDKMRKTIRDVVQSPSDSPSTENPEEESE